MKKVAVVGAGLMGHGIAQIFGLEGFSVHLTDIKPEALESAVENVRANLTLLAEHDIIQTQDVTAALARIATTTDMAQAVADADFVIEAVIENLELKQKLFQDLDALCPADTILATNTSVISITQIAALTKEPGRVVGTHFWNPPYLIPLVEVIRGEHTTDGVMDRTFDILQRVGKHPVRVNKDVPGFVGNRLQHALWREAVSIVENGIADAATVDECVKFGFGLRLPVLGPMENADLVGTDLTLAIHEYILKHLERSPDASPLLKSLVDRGDLGFKSGRGFQQWSRQEADDSHKRLKSYLLQVTSQST
ncbi:MAG: 3-hydroxyacyl-CoA dehydrogenase family protein [Desulfatitalea sp.]|nr:3-hydroxyacyl-CoA dehydrogenase family protein [Desulfatitalea sp.]NNK01000.1 3-hydroxyacyl-CoA dehydrogenase family protein [Desulfatitalea sp.]